MHTVTCWFTNRYVQVVARQLSWKHILLNQVLHFVFPGGIKLDLFLFRVFGIKPFRVFEVLTGNLFTQSVNG